jgi:hypothetical protein
MPQPLRYRRCPACQVVLRASGLRRVTGPTFATREAQRRRCPACDHIGPLGAFRIAPRPESDQGENS